MKKALIATMLLCLAGCGEVTYEKAEEAYAYCTSKGLDTYTYRSPFTKQVNKLACQDKQGRTWPVQYKEK